MASERTLRALGQALTEHTIMEIPPAVVEEARLLAEKRFREGCSSFAEARTSAARTVAGRHQLMPGPIMALIPDPPPEPVKRRDVLEQVRRAAIALTVRCGELSRAAIDADRGDRRDAEALLVMLQATLRQAERCQPPTELSPSPTAWGARAPLDLTPPRSLTRERDAELSERMNGGPISDRYGR